MEYLGSLAGIAVYELQLTGGQAVRLQDILEHDAEAASDSQLQVIRDDLGRIIRDFVHR